MPHPIPLWLSLSLSAALLLAAASSQAQPSPGYNRFLSPEVNAALADPQLPVRKYRGNLSGWTKRFESCISQPAPDLSDPRRQCIAEEITYKLGVTAEYHQSLLEAAKEKMPAVVTGIEGQHRQWLERYKSSCDVENSQSLPFAREQCQLDLIDEFIHQTVQQRTTITSYREATAEQLPPTSQGSATLILGDARIAVTVDDCPTARNDFFHACENVRLVVSTPDIADQHLQLPRVIFSDREDDASAKRGSLEHGFAWGKYSLMLLDLNNDGHEDLMAWTGFEGNYGDPSYTYLLYDPDTQAFVENTAIQALIEMHSLSQVVDGQLEFWYRSGPCLRGEKSIRFEGQTPRIIARNDVNTCTDGLGDN